jgi:SecD-like export protein
VNRTSGLGSVAWTFLLVSGMHCFAACSTVANSPDTAEKPFIEYGLVAPYGYSGPEPVEHVRHAFGEKRNEPPIGVIQPLHRGHVVEVRKSLDQLGIPALYFQLTDADEKEFADFTEKHAGEQVAFFVDGKLVSAATVIERLPGRGILTADWSGEELERLLAYLAPDHNR